MDDTLDLCSQSVVQKTCTLLLWFGANLGDVSRTRAFNSSEVVVWIGLSSECLLKTAGGDNIISCRMEIKGSDSPRVKISIPSTSGSFFSDIASCSLSWWCSLCSCILPTFVLESSFWSSCLDPMITGSVSVPSKEKTSGPSARIFGSPSDSNFWSFLGGAFYEIGPGGPSSGNISGSSLSLFGVDSLINKSLCWFTGELCTEIGLLPLVSNQTTNKDTPQPVQYTKK